MKGDDSNDDSRQQHASLPPVSTPSSYITANFAMISGGITISTSTSTSYLHLNLHLHPLLRSRNNIRGEKVGYTGGQD